MLSAARAYSIGVQSVLVSRGITLVAGVLSLWFLARILSVDDFAAYSVAMAAFFLLGQGAGLGLEHALLLRIAGREPSSHHLAGRTILRKCLLYVAAPSLAVAVGIALAADTIAAAQAISSYWVIALAPIVPATALGLVMKTWFQANHRQGAAELTDGLRDAARCGILGLIFVVSLDAGAVAAAALIAAMLPLVVLTLRARGCSEPAPTSFATGDIAAGLQLLTMRLSALALRQLDIIAVGFVATSVETATYAVVSRLGGIAAVGQMAFLGTFTSRVRRYLEIKDHAAAAREYDTTRALSLLITLAGALGLVLLGRPILAFFGDFER